MTDFCKCWFQRMERAIWRDGLVYCSNCDKPVCCDVVEFDIQVEPHTAEIVGEGRFACRQHWGMVASRFSGTAQ